jgi:tetratricopeptide (TPR) repeat protein
MATVRTAAGDDCVSCHMPKTAAESVQHAAFTDHSIPRRPRTGGSANVPKDATLRAFGDAAATDRELGLAYADVALRSNNRAQGMRAFGLLQAENKRNPEDAKVAAQLAQLYDRMGQESRACELYAAVVASTPSAIAPAVNLGSCLAKQGRLEESIRLWAGVLERSPGQEGARLNLAVAQWQTGEKEKARATLAEALHWNPGSRRAREMVKQFAGE